MGEAMLSARIKRRLRVHGFVVFACAWLLAVMVMVTACGGGGAAEEGLAPDFALSAADGTTVRLSQLDEAYDAVVVVFYRGFS